MGIKKIEFKDVKYLKMSNLSGSKKLEDQNLIILQITVNYSSVKYIIVSLKNGRGLSISSSVHGELY